MGGLPCRYAAIDQTLFQGSTSCGSCTWMRGTGPGIGVAGKEIPLAWQYLVVDNECPGTPCPMVLPCAFKCVDLHRHTAAIIDRLCCRVPSAQSRPGAVIHGGGWHLGYSMVCCLSKAPRCAGHMCPAYPKFYNSDDMRPARWHTEHSLRSGVSVCVAGMRCRVRCVGSRPSPSCAFRRNQLYRRPHEVNCCSAGRQPEAPLLRAAQFQSVLSADRDLEWPSPGRICAISGASGCRKACLLHWAYVHAIQPHCDIRGHTMFEVWNATAPITPATSAEVSMLNSNMQFADHRSLAACNKGVGQHVEPQRTIHTADAC